uniref:Uncharacterized protein n=1 Tax=Lygus hesperus TaxID=30085 RepID=A0A146LIC3_LYGHE
MDTLDGSSAPCAAPAQTARDTQVTPETPEPTVVAVAPELEVRGRCVPPQGRQTRVLRLRDSRHDFQRVETGARVEIAAVDVPVDDAEPAPRHPLEPLVQRSEPGIQHLRAAAWCQRLHGQKSPQNSQASRAYRGECGVARPGCCWCLVQKQRCDHGFRG